jgi:radical SAM-linked protein
MFRERVRVTFGRKGDIRFISHHDLMRLFERALRRTGLPLRLTSGFNPHLRLSFPLPLAVGWEGEGEVMELELANWVPVKEVRDRLVAQLPAGLTLVSMELAKGPGKAQAVEAEFRVRPLTEPLRARLSQEAIDAFLARGEFAVERLRKKRLKSVDVRRHVLAIQLDGEGLTMRMAVSPEGTTRPEEVLSGLGLDREEIASGFHIVRTRVMLRGE